MNYLLRHIKLISFILFCHLSICHAQDNSSDLTKHQLLKSSSSQKKIIENQIIFLKSKADKLFKENNFDSASFFYNKVLDLDKDDLYSFKKLSDINEIIMILEKRKTTVFSYLDLNPDSYYNFKNNIIKDANSIIADNDNGFINLNYSIQFDTSGQNASFANNINSSLTSYSTRFAELISHNTLIPTKEGGYFFASKDQISLNFKWSKELRSFHFKRGEIIENQSINEKNEFIYNYLNNQNIKQGEFTFMIKTKELNNKKFSDIKLLKYKIPGPESAFLSLLFPGLGSLIVSNGQKGIGRLITFVALSGISFYFNKSSNELYSNYVNASNQDDIDLYYDKANKSHKISLVTGTLAASIYLFDIYSAFKRGKNNLNYRRNINSSLANGPIDILNQPISEK
jgi:hypothetical protein